MLGQAERESQAAAPPKERRQWGLAKRSRPTPGRTAPGGGGTGKGAARQTLAHAVQLAPESLAARYAYLQALDPVEGHVRGLSAKWDDLDKAYPSFGVPHYLNALALSNSDDGGRAEALRRLDRCIRVNPFFMPAVHVRHELLMATGDVQKAVTALEEVLSRQPMEWQLWRLLARALGGLEDGGPAVSPVGVHTPEAAFARSPTLAPADPQDRRSDHLSDHLSKRLRGPGPAALVRLEWAKYALTRGQLAQAQALLEGAPVGDLLPKGHPQRDA